MPKRLTAVRKKKRLEQLREAQRRRRTRLKESSQKFVQIILPETVLEKVRRLAGESDQTIQALISQIVERSVGRLEEEDRKERDPARATAENRIADPENDADVESPEEGKSDSDSVEPDDVPGERVEDFADVAEPEASPEEEGLTFENSAVTVESMGVASLAVDSNESSEILETSETAGINPVVGKAQLNLF